MGYPTRYRGSRGSAGPAGSPSGPPLPPASNPSRFAPLGLGAFLAPYLEPEALPAADAAAEAAAGLLGRLGPLGAAGLLTAAGGYLLYRYLYAVPTGPAGPDPAVWNLMVDCGHSGDGWYHSNIGAATACYTNVGPLSATYVTTDFAPNPVDSAMTSFKWHLLPGGRVDKGKAYARIVPTVPGIIRAFSPLPVPEVSPDTGPGRRVLDDPFAAPGDVPFEFMPMPYWAQPYRVPNPWRAPQEQPRRGNTVPTEYPYEPPLWYPSPAPAPVKVPAPAPRPEPATPDRSSPLPATPGPGVSPVEVPQPAAPGDPAAPPTPEQPVPFPPVVLPVTPPGVSPDPAVEGRPQPGASGFPDPAPKLREKLSPGDYGPRLTVGPGQDKGRHEMRKPRKGERERKGRWAIPGVNGLKIVSRGINPFTEALEVVDCAFKSLPKAVRWQILRDSWRQQAFDAAAKGNAILKRPSGSVIHGPSLDLGGSQNARDPAVVSPGGKAPHFKAGSGWSSNIGDTGDLSISLPGGVSPAGRKYVDKTLGYGPDPNAKVDTNGVKPVGRAYGTSDKRGVQTPLSGHQYYQPLSPQAKLKAVWDHYQEMDLNAFISCLAANHVEDYGFGKVGQTLAKAAKNIGHSTGLGTGPVFGRM